MGDATRYRCTSECNIPSGSDNEEPPFDTAPLRTSQQQMKFPKLCPSGAGMSLESDSFPENSNVRTMRRKKRVARRPKHNPMDVDTTPRPSPSKLERVMDVDGAESHISSSSSESEKDAKGGDADDEQSDWVGYSAGDSDYYDPSDRRTRRLNPRIQMSQLQKRLERFALEGSRGEMGIEFKIKDRPNSAKFSKLLLQYRLEVVKRQRGSVVLRKKGGGYPPVAECE